MSPAAADLKSSFADRCSNGKLYETQQAKARIQMAHTPASFAHWRQYLSTVHGSCSKDVG